MGAAQRARLAKRARLSSVEEVLAIPYVSKRSIMSYLSQEGVLELRAASRTCRDAVAEHVWDDWKEGLSIIKGSLASWRRCFPLATAAILSEGHKTVKDADLVLLRGIRKLYIRDCKQITDAGLAHLRGSSGWTYPDARASRTRAWRTCAASSS